MSVTESLSYTKSAAASKEMKGWQMVMERQREPADIQSEKGFTCFLPEVTITLQVSVTMQNVFQDKFAFFPFLSSIQ